MSAIDKIVVVTQKTALEELIERFNTISQARFYIEHMEGSFEGYQQAHDAYVRSLDALRSAIPGGLRCQFIERAFLPTFLFGPADLVVALGRDGLVVNIAKYLDGQPLIGINPDPQRIDGVLLPFTIADCGLALRSALAGTLGETRITMAEAKLNDGQSILALNDLFVGQKSHLSARYRIQFGEQFEDQSSSGIIVSTGAGSTGWLRSVITGASAVAAAMGAGEQAIEIRNRYRFDWGADRLVFSVREPFTSRTSAANLVFGVVDRQSELTVASHMPQNGVIFSDGVEADHLQFNSGAIASIGVSERKLRLSVWRRARDASQAWDHGVGLNLAALDAPAGSANSDGAGPQ